MSWFAFKTNKIKETLPVKKNYEAYNLYCSYEYYAFIFHSREILQGGKSYFYYNPKCNEK